MSKRHDTPIDAILYWGSIAIVVVLSIVCTAGVAGYFFTR